MKGQLDPDFEAAAWNLKPGIPSGIVESKFGYHLILVTDRRPGQEAKFDEVKDVVKEVYCDQLRDVFINYLRPKAKIIINPPPKK